MTPQNRLFASTLVLLTVLVQTACGSSEKPDPTPDPVPVPTLASVSVTPATVTLAVGGTRQLAVTGTYSDGSTKDVTSSASFVSATPATATVSSPGGLVTAVAAGTVQITATVSGKSASTAVTVSPTQPTQPTLSSIALGPNPASVAQGATLQLTVTGTYSDDSTKDVTSSASFVSATPATATVSSPGGLVTAVAAGTVQITATVSGKSASIAVTVSPPQPTLSSIALGPNPASVAQGATLQLTVTGTYSDDSTQNLTSTSTFGSSANSIATVNASGIVTGVTAGSATITASAGGRTATLDVTVTGVSTQPDANQVVFYDGNGTNVTFADFGGAANSVTVDATETFNGRKVINFQVTGTGGYSGGSWVTSTPRDLSGYNALTFWAKASKAETLNVTGIGNDAGASTGTGFGSERTALALTTEWQKFTIPIPSPAKYTNVGGLFHLADAPDGYTLYLADILYENLGASVLGTGVASIANGNTTTGSVATAGTFNIDANQNQVVFTVAGDPASPVTVKPVANTFFDFTSSNTAVASVSATGLITGVGAGGPVTVSATLGGVAATGSYAITVNGVLADPTTLPPAPTHAPGAGVYSLYSSVTGGYTGTASDQSAKVDTWRAGWSAATGGTPFAINAGGGTAAPRKYEFTNTATYLGIEFIGTAGANQINATGLGLTTMHVDLWTPDNATNFQIKLVDFGADGAFGGGDDTEGVATITVESTPPLATGAWLSYELPLATAFPGLANMGHLSQMVLVAPNGGTMFIDNLYFHQ